MVTLTGAMVFNGCSNDVYDPNKVQTEPTKNPLGENFSAPNGFDWSMINTVKLNVSVKDEFAGQYNYLIEVFTSNPLSNTSATPIAAGTAKTNYSAEIAIPKTIERLFIRQTDPKGRKEIYEYVVPENGGTLECRLYYTGNSTTKAMTTRADAGNSGWSTVTDPGYTEETYTPETTGVINGNQLPGGSKYEIKAGTTYTGVIHSYSGTNATVYVEGTWNVSGGITPQGIDIIVLNGGKIISTSGGFMVSDKSSLTIQSGGSVDCYYFSTATNVVIKNFGTFHAKGVRSAYSESNGFNTGTVLYNAKNATFSVDDAFIITSSKIYNHGTIELTNETSGYIKTNDDLSCLIANYPEANIKAYKMTGGATVVNSGFIELNVCENNSNDALYNNCTLIIKDLFTFKNVVLDKGSVSGGKPDDMNATPGTEASKWKQTKKVYCTQPINFTLKNGSMITAEEFTLANSPNNITGEGTDPSVIKVNNLNLTSGGNTYASNIIIELKNPVINASNPSSWKPSNVAQTGYDESKYTIETCGGFYNPGDPGVAPYNPTIPAVNDATKYTYAFEDNWPVYGDFDLNDLVVSLDNKTISSNGKTISFNLVVEAVGASKQLGLGVRLMNLTTTPSAVKINGNSVSLENDSKGPAFIVFDDAHRQFGYTDSRPFINTTKDASLNHAAKTYTVTLQFNSAVSASVFNINNFDLFIISKVADAKGKRTEIHVAGYPPTDLGNTSLFGQGNDDSSTTSGKYYLSTENLAWGIVIPTNFSWPLEYNKVSDVYTEFKPWVTSGGKNNGTWFNTNNGKVY